MLSSTIEYVKEVLEEDTDDDKVVGIFTAMDSCSPIHVSVMLDQKSCKM